MSETKIKLSSNPQGQVYFPKVIRDEWGDKLELLPNVRAGAIYPQGTPPHEVIESLEVIIFDLKHRAKLAKSEEAATKSQRVSG